MSDVINSPKAPAAIGPYVQARTTADLIFTSGQLGMDNDGNLGADITKQTHMALSNLKYILEAGGSSLDKVLKTTVFLSDIKNFAAVNAIYAEYFQAPYPARSCFEVACLPKDALIEVEAIAAR